MKPVKLKKLEWVKCFKLKCEPPLEVYENHINYFGSNVDIDGLDRLIKSKQRHIDLLKEAKKIWIKEFKK
jgi:hypothetical protein